jgi:hypothetical protein
VKIGVGSVVVVMITMIAVIMTVRRAAAVTGTEGWGVETQSRLNADVMKRSTRIKFLLLLLLSRVSVTKDGVRIGVWIY